MNSSKEFSNQVNICQSMGKLLMDNYADSVSQDPLVRQRYDILRREVEKCTRSISDSVLAGRRRGEFGDSVFNRMYVTALQSESQGCSSSMRPFLSLFNSRLEIDCRRIVDKQIDQVHHIAFWLDATKSNDDGIER